MRLIRDRAPLRAALFLLIGSWAVFPAEPGAQASALTWESGCVTRAPVSRIGSPSCWVQPAWDRPGALCLGEAIWLKWLSDPAALPLCGRFSGKWTAHSPLVNSNGPPTAGARAGKEPRLRFHVLDFVSASQAAAPSPRTRLWLWLERRRERLSRMLAPQDRLGILRKLSLDETVPGGAGAMLRLAGFVHLPTATGIHLYALAALWSFFLARFSAVLALPVPILLPLSRALVLVTWISAWTLNGMRLGMLRPWIVVLARKAAELAGFRWRRWSPLVVALAVDGAVGAFLHFSRGQAFDQGRWFYALAVGGGLLAGSGHWRLAISSWIFAALWESGHEGLVATATPVLSLLTIPFFSAFVFPGLLLESFFLDVGWDSAAARLLGGLAPCCQWVVDGITRLTLLCSTVWLLPLWTVGVGAAVAMAGLALRGRIPVLSLGALLVLRGGAALLPGPERDGLQADRVEQLDIGQGDAALVLYHQGGSLRAGLIDSGPPVSLSDAQWIRLFASRGIRELAWVGITHLDEDHAGGVKKLARLLPIHCVATAREQLETERGERYSAELHRLGVAVRELDSGCVPFPFYTARTPQDRKSKENADMSAFLVPLRGGGFYLSPGDADQEDEPAIARWALTQGRGVPRILKIGHHGSKTATAPLFLNLIQPTETWISVGVGNTYGHPSQGTLETLARFQLIVHRTDRDGNLRSDNSGTPLALKSGER